MRQLCSSAGFTAVGSGIAMLALGACHGGVATQTAPGNQSTGGHFGSASGGGGVAGSGGAGGSSVAGTVGFTLDCAQPNLGSPALRLLTRNELENTLWDIFPTLKGQWTGALPSNTLSARGFDNDASAIVGKQMAGALVDTALSVATALTGDGLAGILPCATSASDRTCADQFVTKYGRRLFRRAVSAVERDRYLAFFDASKAKSDFKTALKWLAVGLISSPNAVYRSEIGSDKGDGTRQLSPSEIATALSYTYTGSTPSEALQAQADNGTLGDTLAAARTLMATPPGKQAVQHFFEGYLSYTGVSSVQRPNITNFSAISADMVAETRAFIDDVVLQHGGGLTQLLIAPTTNPSPALASYYGFPAPATGSTSVARPMGRGLGLLAQGAFLTTHASPDSSSPTRRGLFPYIQLLCEKKPSPPPNVPQIAAPTPGQKTTRQRYEEVHGKMGPACAACHQRFDPIGFGFEHFDEGGRYRDKEAGLTIDTSGAVSKADGTALFSFTSQEELVAGLAKQPVIHQCLSAYLATYAFGSDEACLGASNVSALQSGAIGIAEAFARLAAEPHFTKRNSR